MVVAEIYGFKEFDMLNFTLSTQTTHQADQPHR